MRLVSLESPAYPQHLLYLILSHHMIQKKKEYAIALDQQYYSGHSFNAMHTVVGLVPVDGSTLILASNRIFTDKILGFASGFSYN